MNVYDSGLHHSQDRHSDSEDGSAVEAVFKSNFALPLILINLSGKEIARAREVNPFFYGSIQSSRPLMKKLLLAEASETAIRGAGSDPLADILPINQDDNGEEQHQNFLSFQALHAKIQSKKLPKAQAYIAAVQAEHDPEGSADKLEEALDLVRKHPDCGMLPYVAAVQAKLDPAEAIKTVSNFGSSERIKNKGYTRIVAVQAERDPAGALVTACKGTSDSVYIEYRVKALFLAASALAEANPGEALDKAKGSLDAGRIIACDDYCERMTQQFSSQRKDVLARIKEKIKRRFAQDFPYNDDLAIISSAIIAVLAKREPQRMEEAHLKIGEISGDECRRVVLAQLAAKQAEWDPVNAVRTVRKIHEKIYSAKALAKVLAVVAEHDGLSDLNFDDAYTLTPYSKKASIDVAAGLARHDFNRALEFASGLELNKGEALAKIAAVLTERNLAQALAIVRQIDKEESSILSMALAKIAAQL